MAKILGIDYGTKRIGTAIGDTDIRIATPLTVVNARREATRDARAVADLGEREEAEAFVVGLPLNMNGTDSKQTELTRAFAAELERLAKKPVHLQDERLTTVAAHEVLDAAGITPRRQKSLADLVAAQKILQAHFDLHRDRPAGDATGEPGQ